MPAHFSHKTLILFYSVIGFLVLGSINFIPFDNPNPMYLFDLSVWTETMWNVIPLCAIATLVISFIHGITRKDDQTMQTFWLSAFFGSVLFATHISLVLIHTPSVSLGFGMLCVLLYGIINFLLLLILATPVILAFLLGKMMYIFFNGIGRISNAFSFFEEKTIK